MNNYTVRAGSVEVEATTFRNARGAAETLLGETDASVAEIFHFTEPLPVATVERAEQGVGFILRSGTVARKYRDA